jgi:hypothetical protein
MPTSKNANSTSAENRDSRPNWRTGAPDGNRNALKHGRFTKEAKARRAELRVFLRKVRADLAEARLYLAECALEEKLKKVTRVSPYSRLS